MSKPINRPLKFRAWDEDKKRMYYDIDSVLLEIPVMQFTGVYDSENKPIYEGDIFKFGVYDLTYHQVEFKEGVFGFLRLTSDCCDGHDYLEFTSIGDWDKHQLIVIGNIYENPEFRQLLTKEEK